MIVMIPATILTIIVLNVLLAPLMLGTRRQKILGWTLLVCMTVMAAGIYLAHGAPVIASAPALFEKAGPRYEQRQSVKHELELTSAVNASPGDTGLMLELGTIRLQNGRIDAALAVLNAAHSKAPADKAISTKLGAAHYAAALAAYLIEDDAAAAARHFDKALLIAPQDAPYYQRLLADRAKYQEDVSQE